jgi:predicted SnoaL-like aldol condensation-catalyzing enzyme
MEPYELDRELVVRQTDARIATTTSERQRRMLEVYREHMIAEMGGELDRLMATMVPEPRFHSWSPNGDQSPKGRDAVMAFYGEWFALKANWFDVDIQRMVVDDEFVVVEIVQRMIMPAESYLAGRWGRHLRRADGTLAGDLDPTGHYLLIGQSVNVIPFDEQCLMMGEDGYSSGPSSRRRLDDAEVSPTYLAFLAS